MPFAVHPGPDDPIQPDLDIPPPGCEVTERYDEIDVGDLAGLVPLFRVVHSENPFAATPEQVRAGREETEQYYLSLSIWRHWARLAANELGFPARCPRSACRRRGGCAGDRHEFDWSFPGPWMPPCGSTIRLVDQIRDLIHLRVGEVLAGETPGRSPAVTAPGATFARNRRLSGEGNGPAASAKEEAGRGME